MSALSPEADMCGALAHVCFGPIADSCTAAKNRYSITSSARASSADDKLKPSAFAVRIYSRAVFAMPLSRSEALAGIAQVVLQSPPRTLFKPQEKQHDEAS